MSDHAKDERAPDENQAAEAAAERTEGSVGDDYEALVRLLKENEDLKDRALRDRGRDGEFAPPHRARRA